MQTRTFIAESAVQAVDQIRRDLGSDAVVLNVRPLPAKGLARLWQKQRFEVMACLPQPSQATPTVEALEELRQELAQIKQAVSDQQQVFQSRLAGLPISTQPMPSGAVAIQNSTASHGQLGTLLERSGLLATHVQRVLTEVCTSSNGQTSDSLAAEIELARAALVRLWPEPQVQTSNVHIFIGPSGVGKTTALSKWLAQAVLVEGRSARVFRLDSHVANTAESLSVYAEILGVPVERVWPDQCGPDPSEMLFVDLPGVNWSDRTRLEDLAGRLKSLPGAQFHLVLNAAYEGQLLVAQARAFSALPVTDVIFTHLDEEPRWGKLWNFVLGTNYRVSFLSEGQNIPADFLRADPEAILARNLPRN